MSMLTRDGVRSSLVLALAGGAIVTAALLAPRARMRPAKIDPVPAFHTVSSADDGIVITAALPTAKLLPGTSEQDLAVTITTPRNAALTRPPLSLAIVIDRSHSMEDSAIVTPMSDAKRAAAQLVERLTDEDAFTVITFSDGDETVTPMARATASNKELARAAIARIATNGGTCISCGMERGARELSHTPIVNGLSRMVLIGDGAANFGLGMVDRSELSTLAATTAARGVSITSVGVGLDFDEVTMQNIAQHGRGNYYFVANSADLAAQFDREVSALSTVIAADVTLSLSGVDVTGIYGYPMTKDATGVHIPIADLRAGETRKVVLRVTVDATRPGPFAVSQARLDWRRVSDGQLRKSTATAIVEIVNDAGAVARSVDRAAVLAIEEAATAKALDDAAQVLERQGPAAAQRVIDLRLQTMRTKDLPAADTARLEAAAPSFAQPAAAKAARATAYGLAR